MLCRRGKRCGPFPFPMWFFLVTFYHLLKKPRYNFCRRILGQTADEISETQCLCGFPALSYYNAFVNPPNNSCGFHTIPPVAVSHRKLSGGLFFHRIVFARFDGIIRKECPRLEEMCFFAARQLDSAWLFRQSIRIWKLHPALARSLRERRGLLYGETHPQASSFSKPASP